MVISTLDARGLYTEMGLGDASQHVILPADPALQGYKSQIVSESHLADADVLGSLADQTGGTYFHNNNDFALGFQRAGAFPEAYYLLAFAPLNLKPDGRLHTLKVTLASNPGRYTLQARRGYFAPRKTEDPATAAKEELEQMIYAQEESQTIPVQVHTQFFKTDAGSIKLSVLTHVDISRVRFRKAEGRNVDDFTVVTVVFDQAGGFVTGQQKTIQFHLLDSTLAKLNQTGLSLKTSLDVKPGTYLVRSVVQDSEDGLLAAQNSQVEIPY